jgi:rhodanese-related sulfurtransferase
MAKHAPRFLQLVDEAKGRIRQVTVAEVKQRLDQGESFYLVDVREDGEWAAGHISKAIHLGKGIIERDIEQAIPNASAEIVLYCGGGFRSALAAENLHKMGYENAVSMVGGFTVWRQGGLPVE